MEQQKPTILLVDDTSENLDVLTGTLRGDYNLKAEINGKGALKLAKMYDPT